MRTSHTAVDQFGRVVIPKEFRDDLGMEPGTMLEVRQEGDHLLLTPIRGEEGVSVKDGVAVFTGALIGDIVDALEKDRQRRLSKLGLKKSKRR